MVELLQLIVGPGSRRVSGAKLARTVERLINEGTLTYEALVASEGIGVAKACQVISAYELAKRLAHHT